MKFIVDAQVFQTSTWHRGMGKYSLELLKALQAHGYFDKKELEFVFNTNLELDSERRSLLAKLFPIAKFTELDLRITDAVNLQEVQVYNKQLLDSVYKAGDFTFLILSLFEYNAVSVFPTNGRKVLVAYDLIPILFYDRYLTHSDSYRNNYLGRFTVIFNADHIFPISQTTADDFTRYLGLPLDKLTTIDGARIDLSEKVDRPDYVPTRKFILSASGDDLRKNNERMVRGFEEFNAASGRKYELLITSNFTKQSQQKLKKLSPDVHFVGNVSADELRWYYQNADLVMFVPEYEGLGLPVLEAVAAGRKVVCSDIPVFREIAPNQKTFFFCDPYDTESISSSIQAAVKKGQPDLKEYSSIEKKYSWSRTASLFANACNALALTPPGESLHKKKIAVVGPLPGGKSAIGKVIEISHYALSRRVDIDYYFECPKADIAAVRKSFVGYSTNTFDISEFNATVASEYDGIIYHLGSSTYHLKSIIEALAVPGVTILHDTRFSGAYGVLQSQQMMSDTRVNAEKALDTILGVNESADHIVSLVNIASRVVIHSKFAQKAVNQCFITDKKSAIANLPIGLAEPTSRASKEQVTVAMAGIISKVKGLNILTDLLKSGKFDNCKFVLFGYDFAINDTILAPLKRYKNLQVKTNLSELEFRQQLGKADILLNYREYYHGETSYAALEAMREGVVPIVRDIGWFSELPDNAVKKAPTPGDVAIALQELIDDKEQRAKMSVACYDYVLKKHSPAVYAKQLADLL